MSFCPPSLLDKQLDHLLEPSLNTSEMNKSSTSIPIPNGLPFRIKLFFLIFIFYLSISFAWAFEPFTVKDIRVEGLQRISAGTVFNYFPVEVGDRLDSSASSGAIRALFRTGFFKDIQLGRDGNDLVIKVVERPGIASIDIEGNEDINTEDLTKGLKGIGLSVGEVYNRQVLDKVQQELRRQYFSRGKYGVEIKSTVSPMERNRVAIRIKISEGKVAKIKQINVVGNNSFDEDELLDSFELGTTHLISFYTRNDQYSKQKLSADLERLRSYYLDRGYIKFAISSTQVSITPDKKEIYITVNVKEGDIYTLSEVKLAGDLVIPPDDLIPLVLVGPEETFSRKRATETSKSISDRLGEEGYAFANVNMVPDINEDDKTVKITFFVDPGKRTYIRRIEMRGNTKTRDEVLRREMRQMEGAWASTTKIERSKERLQRLGYFEDVNVETPAVVGTTDQIDAVYSVTEKSSGTLSAGLGFSQGQGLVFNASVTQDNVLGTGKRVGFTFNNSQVTTIYRINYFNPYFTIDGISFGYDILYRAVDAEEANISKYTTDVFSTGINFGIPLNEHDRLGFNLDFKRTKLNASTNSPKDILGFINNRGIDELTNREDPTLATDETYFSFPLTIGLTHDTRDRAVFPTRGGMQRVSLLATIPGFDLEYYKASVSSQLYFPIASDLTLKLSGEAAYGGGYGGTGPLPFFEHYFAGGVHSIRGFKDNTLGPRDTPFETDRRGDSFGGNSKFIASAELFFPIPFIKDSKSFRLGVFADAGNVYDGGFDFGDLRYSVGISAKWLSPFGPLTVSVAQPFNDGKDDEVERFQFSIGAGF